MDTEKTKDGKDKAGRTDSGCNPEDFKGMFEMMDKCCSAQDGMPDCSAMMKTMLVNCSKTQIKKQ